ncbi:MAG: hypothetical protein E7300_03455 [Lachnospiraceae bacterium]|jgi:hypothetical protein|nr:hypothetical protein [Lachnospiraceae bacterium]
MKKKKVHHDVQTVAEKKFWQTFSAKNVIKWYEYQMAPAEDANEEDAESQNGAFVAEPRENLEDEVSRIMNAFQNSKQDSVDSLLREMGEAAEPVAPVPEPAPVPPQQDAAGEELNMDGVDPEMVARIMDSFKTAKQDSVDSLFAAAEAEAALEPEPEAEQSVTENPAPVSEENTVTEKAEESEEEILADIASRSQQNQIDALFANQ